MKNFYGNIVHISSRDEGNPKLVQGHTLNKLKMLKVKNIKGLFSYYPNVSPKKKTKRPHFSFFPARLNFE